MDDSTSGTLQGRVLTTRNRFGELLNACGLLGPGAEVGVQCGKFSEHILRCWKGRPLILVDAWRYFPDCPDDHQNVSDAEHERRYHETLKRLVRFANRFRIHRMLSEEAAALYRDGELDWAYIDARHNYSAVRSDLHAWYPTVKPGGIFAGHDYFNGVRDPINPRTRRPIPVPDSEVTPEILEQYGVKAAVDEFAALHGKQVFVTTADTFNSWWWIK